MFIYIVRTCFIYIVRTCLYTLYVHVYMHCTYMFIYIVRTCLYTLYVHVCKLFLMISSFTYNVFNSLVKDLENYQEDNLEMI